MVDTYVHVLLNNLAPFCPYDLWSVLLTDNSRFSLLVKNFFCVFILGLLPKDKIPEVGLFRLFIVSSRYAVF